MLYFLCSRMSRKFESERPEIYVIWWNDGLLGYNVNVSDDQQPIQKSKWFIFLNKLSIVENTKKIINEKN
jgi:ABC-type phosphate/phosphonate transport system substrate-binding protein